MAYDGRALVGVGGWLAFFIVTLALNALGSAVQPFLIMQTPGTEQIGAPWSAYLVFVWILAAVKVAGYCYAAWSLNARHVPQTPRRVIALLWILALAPSLIDAAVGAVLLSIPAARAGEIAGAGLFRPLVYAAVWTAYLLRSDRVANTYTPGREEDDTLAAVFE